MESEPLHDERVADDDGAGRASTPVPPLLHSYNVVGPDAVTHSWLFVPILHAALDYTGPALAPLPVEYLPAEHSEWLGWIGACRVAIASSNERARLLEYAELHDGYINDTDQERFAIDPIQMSLPPPTVGGTTFANRLFAGWQRLHASDTSAPSAAAAAATAAGVNERWAT